MLWKWVGSVDSSVVSLVCSCCVPKWNKQRGNSYFERAASRLPLQAANTTCRPWVFKAANTGRELSILAPGAKTWRKPFTLPGDMVPEWTSCPLGLSGCLCLIKACAREQTLCGLLCNWQRAWRFWWWWQLTVAETWATWQEPDFGPDRGAKVTSGWARGRGKGQSSSFHAPIASETSEEDEVKAAENVAQTFAVGLSRGRRDGGSVRKTQSWGSPCIVGEKRLSWKVSLWTS